MIIEGGAAKSAKMTGKNVTASNYVQAARKPLKVRD